MKETWGIIRRRSSDAMGAKFSRFATFLFALIIILSQTRSAMAEDHSCEKYQSDMVKSAASMTKGDMFLADQIFTEPEFVNYLNDAEPYSSCAEDFILNDGNDLNARVMAVLSLQGMPQDKLFPVLDRIVQAAINGEINRSKSAISELTLLQAALFPRPNLNAFLYLFYDEPRSKKLLSDAQRVPDLDKDLREHIELARSGKGRDRYFSYVDIGQNIRLEYRLDGSDVSALDLIPKKP